MGRQDLLPGKGPVGEISGGQRARRSQVFDGEERPPEACLAMSPSRNRSKRPPAMRAREQRLKDLRLEAPMKKKVAQASVARQGLAPQPGARSAFKKISRPNLCGPNAFGTPIRRKASNDQRAHCLAAGRHFADLTENRFAFACPASSLAGMPLNFEDAKRGDPIPRQNGLEVFAPRTKTTARRSVSVFHARRTRSLGPAVEGRALASKSRHLGVYRRRCFSTRTNACVPAPSGNASRSARRTQLFGIYIARPILECCG